MLIYCNQEKLKELLLSVNSTSLSQFYTDLHKSVLSPDPSPEEIVSYFEKLPLLTRADISKSHPDSRLYIPKKDVSFVSYTSGTTDGSPLVLYWSPVENYFFEPSIGTASRTPLILHPALNKNFGHTFIQQCRQAKTPVTPVFADFQNLTHSAILASQTNADGIYTTPTLALLIADQIDKHYDSKHIKLLALFSESLTSQKRENLRKRYPNAEIANLYASSEVGQILFYPCERMIDEGSNEFHFLDEAIVALELSDEGELILTMNQNKAFPLIRYRTGDFFELKKNGSGQSGRDSTECSCSCGLTTPILSWSGRMDGDKLRLNGVEIKTEDIETAMEQCKGDIQDLYQLHFYPIEKSESIRIVVEVLESDYIRGLTTFGKIEIQEKIRNTLMHSWYFTATATLETAVQKGIFTVPEISFVPELSLKTTKTRKIVNHIV